MTQYLLAVQFDYDAFEGDEAPTADGIEQMFCISA